MAVHFGFGQRIFELGVVCQFAVWFGEAALVVVAQHCPVGQSAPARESTERDELDLLDHTKTLQCN